MKSLASLKALSISLCNVASMAASISYISIYYRTEGAM